jgi:hypothetical protein
MIGTKIRPSIMGTYIKSITPRHDMLNSSPSLHLPISQTFVTGTATLFSLCDMKTIVFSILLASLWPLLVSTAAVDARDAVNGFNVQYVQLGFDNAIFETDQRKKEWMQVNRNQVNFMTEDARDSECNLSPSTKMGWMTGRLLVRG